MSKETIKIPYGVMRQIMEEMDPVLYESATRGNVLLKIGFSELEGAYQIGDEVAEAAGVVVQKYQLLDEETNSGIWVFHLGRDERQEHPQRLKILNELRDRGISSSPMRVYLPSISENDMARLEQEATRLLEKDFNKSVESIPNLLRSGYSYIF